MDEAIITDLKQFISAVISQQTADLRQEMHDMHHGITRLEQKMDEGFSAIADIVESMNNSTDTQFAEHDRRIRTLEQAAGL